MWYIFYVIGNRDVTFEYQEEKQYLLALGDLTLNVRVRIISHGRKETLASLYPDS